MYSEGINLKARAKINLGLDVVKRLENGYHEVRMVMQSIDLYDEIFMKKTKSKDIKIETNVSFLPVDESNLVYRAIKLLFEKFEISDFGVYVNLNKKIPVAAGMAGGSTDAAAAMIGVNKLFNLGLSVEKLCELGVQIGADVPFCIMRGTVLAEGIGEILTPLPPLPRTAVLIAKPDVSVSTKGVYQHLQLGESTIHPDMDGVIEAIKNEDVIKMASLIENVLETVTIKEHPVIDDIKEFMMSKGAVKALMSGSGPTVFGLFDNEETAYEAYKILKTNDMARQVYITHTFNPRRKPLNN